MKFINLIFVFCVSLQINSYAGSIRFLVTDTKKNPLNEVVIMLTPIKKELKLKPVKEVILQKDENFVPELIVIPVGSSVSFSNQDPFNHHVYSISKTHPFELPFFKKGDKNPSPVHFDKEGIISVGCNIHDHMSATIVVTSSPYFTKTSNGYGVFTDLGPGEYQVTLWHKSQGDKFKKDLKPIKVLSSATDELVNLSF